MDDEANKPTEHLPDVAQYLRPEDLCELDVFRFSEDGRFAFCEEFADWGLLEERGWLDF